MIHLFFFSSGRRHAGFTSDWGSDVCPSDLLGPLLQDASRTPYGKVEIRDLALAALLHLSGQNLVEFGFLRHRPNPTFVFEPNRLLFESPEARAKAIQRWRDQRSRESSPDE